MASLVLGTAGAIAGSFVGAPQIGWAVGSALGSFIDRKTQHSEGPRLADLKVQISTWGTMIPLIYGAMRVAGNVIWSTDLRESSTTESQGGKGGPSSETTTYSYSVDVAIALCEGPITAVRKMWANGKLIYNAGGDATLETLLQSSGFASNVAVYIGDETQLPDSTMEASLGAGNVPGYRGTAYIVFTNLQLSDYGNRIPNLEFEVVTSDILPGTYTDAFTTFTAQPKTNTYDTTTANKSLVHVHRAGGPLRILVGDWDESRATNGVTVVDVHVDGVIAPITSFSLTQNSRFAPGNSDEPGILNHDPGIISGEVYYTNGSGVTQTLVASSGALLNADGGNGTDLRWAKRGRYLVLMNCGVPADSPKYMFDLSTSIRVEFTLGSSAHQQYDAALTDDFLYILTKDSSGTNPGNAIVKKYTFPELAFVADLPSVPTSSFSGLAVGTSRVHVDAVSDAEVYMVDTDNLIWEVANGSAESTLPTITGDRARLSQQTFVIQNGSQAVLFAPFVVGVTVVDTVGSSNPGQGAVYYRTAGGIETDPSTVTVATAVTDLCARAGLSSIDASALTDTLTGYAITRPDTARNNIEQLQKCFYFDAVESDNQIKFVVRGGASLLTVPAGDLAARYDTDIAGDPVNVRRVQETELPARVTINYIDPAADYQQGTESAQRIFTESAQQVVDGLAVAMTPDKAAQVAEATMYDAHIGRTLLSFNTTQKYAKYEPTDVFTISNQASAYRARLTKKDMSGPLIKWEAVAEAAQVYAPAAQGASTQEGQVQIETAGPTQAAFLDIPIVRDQDDDSGFYLVMGGYKNAWTGAAAYRSPDDVTFAPIGNVTRSSPIGVCGTVLGGWVGGNLFDESNTVTVVLSSGELSGTTRADVFGGANAAVIGNEILQFRAATLIAPNTYRLSGLLRGQRGTEQHISTHGANERFVLLGAAGTLRPVEGPSAIGALRYYKPVTSGQRIVDAPSVGFANAAVGLKPLAPVYLRGGKNIATDDFEIAWSRRTRIDREWRDLVDVALGETTEEYEIDVMDGVNVIRTETVSSPAFTYTSAMQTTDFGGPQTSVAMRIYQMSSVVGRGFVSSKTFS